MNTAKARIAGISLLSRAFNATADEELAAVISALPDEHRTAIDKMADGTSDEARIAVVRDVVQRGKVSGDMEQIGLLLSDPCLVDCIEQLGENAELPSADQLDEVLPGLIERHGVPATRLMLASAVAGQAPSSAAITQILKSHDQLALPPIDAVSPRLVVEISAAEAQERELVKARRKEERAAKQAQAAARRQQASDARRKSK